MRIDVSFPGGLRVDAALRGFTIHTDQPRPAGGEDSAPTPFELFLASLATCAGIYMLGFLRQRHLDTEHAGVTMSLERDRETGMVGFVELELHVPPEFPQKYAAALVRAVELCAVKKHLHQPPEISVKVVGGQGDVN